MRGSVEGKGREKWRRVEVEGKSGKQGKGEVKKSGG